jgi:LCP family protein required for cell wall assembly
VDDMELLRDLGRELEHEPPATLVRQRRRLLEAGDRRRFRVPGGRWTLLGVVAAVTAAAILVPAFTLQGRGARPVTADSSGGASKAMNVLVVGSDGGHGAAARADTLVLMHLPADRASVRSVSIPRDSLVDVPACEGAGGRIVPAHRGPISSALAAGPSCVQKTVESQALVRVDTTVVIGFDGFRAMVDALGGVDVDVPRTITDAVNRPLLRAGRQHLNGKGALVYVRERRGLGDGSDLPRIVRQQKLMAAVLKRAKDEQVKNPLRFARFLAVAVRSVRTSPRMDLGALESLAKSMRKTDAGAVAYVTVPTRPAPDDPSRLVWKAPQARAVFAQFGKN